MTSLMKESWQVRPPAPTGPSTIEVLEHGAVNYIDSVPAQALTAMAGTGALFLYFKPAMARSFTKAVVWMLVAGVAVYMLSKFVTWNGIKGTVKATTTAVGITGGAAKAASSAAHLGDIIVV